MIEGNNMLLFVIENIDVFVLFVMGACLWSPTLQLFQKTIDNNSNTYIMVPILIEEQNIS